MGIPYPVAYFDSPLSISSSRCTRAQLKTKDINAKYQKGSVWAVARPSGISPPKHIGDFENSANYKLDAQMIGRTENEKVEVSDSQDPSTTPDFIYKTKYSPARFADFNGGASSGTTSVGKVYKWSSESHPYCISCYHNWELNNEDSRLPILFMKPNILQQGLPINGGVGRGTTGVGKVYKR